MPPILNVYDLPTSFEPEQLRGGAAVVIDVLRASTTIVHALQAGARDVKLRVTVTPQSAERMTDFAPLARALGVQRVVRFKIELGQTETED